MLTFSDYAQATLRRGGKVVGYSESPLEGTSAGSDTTEDGEISRSAFGRAPQNEDGALRASRLLVKRLNLQGARWSVPEDYPQRDSNIDCYAEDPDTKGILNIQVVRADSGDAFWRELSNTGSAVIQHPLPQAVEMIRAAIIKKERIPLAERGKLVLVLDATVTPDLIHSEVVEVARSAFGSEIRALAFRGIYLVGPEPQHVHRLDT